MGNPSPETIELWDLGWITPEQFDSVFSGIFEWSQGNYPEATQHLMDGLASAETFYGTFPQMAQEAMAPFMAGFMNLANQFMAQTGQYDLMKGKYDDVIGMAKTQSGDMNSDFEAIEGELNTLYKQATAGGPSTIKMGDYTQVVPNYKAARELLIPQGNLNAQQAAANQAYNTTINSAITGQREAEDSKTNAMTSAQNAITAGSNIQAGLLDVAHAMPSEVLAVQQMQSDIANIPLNWIMNVMTPALLNASPVQQPSATTTPLDILNGVTQLAISGTDLYNSAKK